MAWIPHFGAADRARYAREHNARLGWGPAVDDQGRVLRLEPRFDPSYPARAGACASAYGDSFTGGAMAPDQETYPARLGQRLGCRVANYGVSAFGSDQALLLLRAQRHLDEAPVVILGHVSENILRNVNRYRNLLYPGDRLLFKPRFVLSASGELRDLASPVRDVADLDAVRRAPEQTLRGDWLLMRPRREFPYAWSLARWLAGDFHLRAYLSGRPRHASLYEPEHPSGALALTTAILAAFADEAQATNRVPLVALIPVGADLLYARRTGRWIDRPLAEALRSRGVRTIHVGPDMLQRLGSRDPCTLFSECHGHFNPEGYRLLAEIVFASLEGVRYPSGAVRATTQ